MKEVEEPFRRFEDIWSPNPVQKYFAGSIDDIHHSLSHISLNETVPADVRQMFDTAKNLSLYSWFIYRFHAIAELTGFIALEAALNARATKEGITRSRPLGLKQLLDLAIKEEWLTEAGIPDKFEIATRRARDEKVFAAISDAGSEVEEIEVEDPSAAEIEKEMSEMRILEPTCAAAPKLRNSLAHGKFWVDAASASMLRTTAGLINQLFPVASIPD